ncbi:MAG TPA: permease [Desulfobacteraceae bacterium]|nr:permease [Desulfobacteraceae bacterium]
MDLFLRRWGESAHTSLGFFWMALWAFALGYIISSLIQVLVTQKRMKAAMGDTGPKSIALGTFFGFISSSCSFAALSTTRALFQKGAGLVPSLAFMLSSTNLVIELGIVIAIFLSWQFVVGEYLGGLLLIFLAWGYVRLTRPDRLVKSVRERFDREHEDTGGEKTDWKEKALSLNGWQQIGMQYVMEWQMVWKDVLIGFTVAGIIAAFVPDAFFEALFTGSGSGASGELGFPSLLAQTLVGPLAAFLTFIGSMGNIPLAALLFDRGVSFAGVMAFIFSDLVVLPVLRINAEYYGWKMALYIMSLLLTCLVAAALLMHYGFLMFGLLPENSPGTSISERAFFEFNYGFFLNILFMAVSAVLVWLWRGRKKNMDHDHHHGDSKTGLSEKILRVISILALAWLSCGMIVYLVYPG